ncbi:MAG: 4Fe-4S binding protein [Clostridia bacterium]|nr:4Fe-4S binding protein [Clostridia bacterium]
MSTELTASIVKAYGIHAGADVVGIAASKDFGLAPDGFKPADVLPECISVVVLGAASQPEAFHGIAEYTDNRNAMLTAMTNTAKEVAKRVKAGGWKTKVISASGGKWVDHGGKKEQFGYISLKHAAEIAGLGVLGKNRLLTNPLYGNRLWLSAVLTDAELTPDERIGSTMCEHCSKCVDACPAGALNDPATFGRKGCSAHYVIEDRKLKIMCFTCRTVCPLHCAQNML